MAKVTKEPPLTNVQEVRLQQITQVIRRAAREAAAKHGAHQTPINPQMPIGEKLAILVEEVGEVARALTYDQTEDGGPHLDNLKKELEQVAAMAVMWRASL